MTLRHPAVVAAPGIVALVLAAIALARSGDEDPAPAAGPRELTLPELYDRVDGAVARIEGRRPADAAAGVGRRVITGAAFLLDADGHLVTNAHIIRGARTVTVRFGLATRRIRAEIVGRDRPTDLAVVKVDPARVAGERPLPLAPPATIQVGDPVLAVGTPYRLQSSASAGIVSAVGRPIRAPGGFTTPDAIQTDAELNPGNSGGPLLDRRGRVVGVTTQRRAPGVVFAVSSTTVARIVPQLIRDGRARSAFLGVAVDDRNRVLRVDRGGPADDAGIRAKDVILEIDGRRTDVEGAVPSAVAAHRPGERVEVVLRRRTVTVTLGVQPRRP